MKPTSGAGVQAFFQDFSGANRIDASGSKVLFRLFSAIVVLSPLGLIPMFLDSDPKRFFTLVLVGIIALFALSVRMGMSLAKEMLVEDQRIVFLPAGYEVERSDILSIKTTEQKRDEGVRIAIAVSKADLKYFIGALYWVGKSITLNVKS